MTAQNRAEQPAEVDERPLGMHLRLLARAMRRMPVGIRRVDWWWSELYRKVGGGGFSEDPDTDQKWPRGLQAPIRGANHPYLMRLDLQDWMERRAYFSGAIYQRDLEDVLMAITRPGDQFIDIGANIGLITLLAAHLVGDRGDVVACEANPAVVRRVEENVALNGLTDRVKILKAALGSEESTAYLFVKGTHTGVGTLAGASPGGVEVQVARGDTLLPAPDPERPLIVKLDVEGYEQRVIDGMAETLSHPNVALVVEVTDFMLKRVGDSAQALYDSLHRHGYEGYSFQVDHQRFGRVLQVSRSSTPIKVEQYDALFVKPGSSLEARVPGLGAID